MKPFMLRASDPLEQFRSRRLRDLDRGKALFTNFALWVFSDLRPNRILRSSPRGLGLYADFRLSASLAALGRPPEEALCE